MSLLGIDVGTTGCKVVAFSTDGMVLAQSSAEYPLTFPRPGWIELDPRIVWRKLSGCIKQVAGKTKRDPITALAVSSQGEAFMPVDRNGTPLRNSIVTFDSRAQDLASKMGREIGREEIYRLTGIPLSGMSTLPKIQWVKTYEPEVHARANRYLCFQDFIVQKLGLEPSIDYSLAARTMAFDGNANAWSKTMLNLVGLDAEMLAGLVPSGTVLGEVKRRAAQKLGLPNNVKVVAGGHDQPCGALGAGVIRRGDAAYAIGTVECITPVFSERKTDSTLLENNLCQYPHVVSGRYLSLLFNFTGGSLLRWYRDTFGGEYEKIVRSALAKPSSLMVLPHFTMTGTPYFDTRSGGVVAGLSLSTRREEITRALLEGVTYEMRLNVEILDNAGIRINRYRAVGGGSQSDVWMKIKASILNRPIEVMAVQEAACLGAALLAGMGTGIYRSPSEAVGATVRGLRTYDPDSREARTYNDYFELYKELYPTLRKTLHELHRLSNKEASS